MGTPVALATSPAPVAAAPSCGPSGGPPPTQVPWPLRRLDPASAWALSRGGGVVVAVIDSGVSATHPVLRGRVRTGRDFGLPDRSGQCDEVGHGTMIAGIIAGRDDTDAPFSGIAPDARILPIRVLEDATRSHDPELPTRIADAIRYAVDQGADVVNLSLETLPTPALESAVDYARDNDVVLVAAGGNQPGGEQRDQPAYPAGYDSVLAVAGIDEQGNHVGTSISGNYLDIAAPGLFIEGPAPQGGGYRTEPDGGTSFATAYVSGVVALVRSRYPKMPADEVIRRVTRTADGPPEGHNNLVGYGVVNPYRAVATVFGSRSNSPLGALNPAPTPPDPLGTARLVAIWAAGGGLLFTALVLGGAPIVRRGRRRGWRPGRTASTPDRTPGPGRAAGGLVGR